MQQPHSLAIATLLVVLAVVDLGSARDLRNVTEPKVPETCTSLKATGKDDTQAIQKALDACAKGKAVALSSGTFYSGPLTIPTGVNLLVEDGVTLKAIPNPALYDLGDHKCGTVDDVGVGCKAFISIIKANGSGIYGKGVIDGQADVTLTARNYSWWDLSTTALVMIKYQNNPRLVMINNSYDITLYQITLKNSPIFTVCAYETNGFTAWGVNIYAPASARNTDGINPIGSQNVTIAHCNISIGDDNVAIKAFNAPSRHISVLNNHFGHGNGMSIGSEIRHGARDVYVSGITFNGSINGVHVKSNTFRGGHVTGISFNNLCMINVYRGIHLDMDYMNLTGDQTPVFHDIQLNNIWVVYPAKFIFVGESKDNPVRARIRDLHVAKGSTWSESNAVISGTPVEDATPAHKCGYAGNE